MTFQLTAGVKVSKFPSIQEQISLKSIWGALLELIKICLFAGYDYEYQRLEFVQKLGEGNFAVVHLAKGYDICGNTGKSMVAVKELKGTS